MKCVRFFSGNVAQASLLEILMRNTLFFDAGVFTDVEYELLIATWKVTLHWAEKKSHTRGGP